MSLSINYHGFFDGNFGIAEATRLNAAAMEKAGIKVNRINYSSDTLEKIKSETKQESSINIFHINSNVTHEFFSKNQDIKLAGHYNIVYWAWEFPEVSDKTVEFLNIFDELWVPSDFCVNIFTKYTGIPVMRFSHPIEKLTTSDEFDCNEYNIKPNSKVYVTIFDSLSTTIRKNPEATIDSFIKVFKNDPESVLIVKTHNLERSKDAQKALEKYSAIPNIIMINDHFSKEKLHSLIQKSDVLISLHGSEGFGLTMAEAMSYGKIVVGTGYSGNLDFMNVNNSFLVQYDFVKTSNTKGLIAEGLTLARPNIDDAAEKLQYIKDHFTELNTIKSNAEKQIRENFSIESIGDLFKIRLSFIHNFDKKETSTNSVDNVFHLAEIDRLNGRVNYLEKTLYNKIRKKVNIFLKKMKGKKEL
ncbi:glycosyltransferase family 1 protein [Chryseobacterium nematophagum]|uniref:Glycosyltransferase family 1 protein n=1 Tax=Chryseobacterium nematophagum TaxID=2305228 RepID=A0A3M7L611_9FLAO|nr:glycosyltransferase [Chryseobacterium nematophagum]RMZ58151.1 glycosyltransferase family 1 protein [Chryseobacterium nematophagum]